MQRTLATLVVTTLVAACGGGEQADTAADQPAGQAGDAMAAGATSMPSWMRVDTAAKTVTMDIVAGQSNANNNWNYNGYFNGNATITVREGYAVTINFRNNDPAIAHSLGISSQVGSYPPQFQNPQPVFAGAMSTNPTDVMNATRPGATETIRFTAGTAGQYAMVCYVPAHATAGMWIHFNVSSDGTEGVSTM